MAQDTGYDIATGPTVTLLSTDLSDNLPSGVTAKVDFGSPAPLGFGYELTIKTGTGCVDSVLLEIAWSHDDTDWSDTDNMQLVDTVQCTASATKKKVGASVIKARWAKFRLFNDSGGTIDGTSAVTALLLWDIFADQN